MQFANTINSFTKHLSACVRACFFSNIWVFLKLPTAHIDGRFVFSIAVFHLCESTRASIEESSIENEVLFYYLIDSNGFFWTI